MARVRVDSNPSAPNPKTVFFEKEIDSDLDPGCDPAFYWHPVITFEFP